MSSALWLFALSVSVFVVPQPAYSQTFTVLYQFTGAADGGFPSSDVIVDAQDNIYGTTSGGGSHNFGTVFRISATGKESVVHNFAGAPDGAMPEAGLLRDKDGNLYGTTYSGGDINCAPLFGGCGTVFKIDRMGRETVLHSFESSEGTNPLAGLIADTEGNLYGSTFAGGNLSCLSAEGGCGTIFRLDNTGKLTVLYVFGGAPDAANPRERLTLDVHGNLYGITEFGGDYSCAPHFAGCGTVFKLDSAGHNTVLHSFAGYPTDGTSPQSPLFLDVAGNIYGSAVEGGNNDDGILFRIDRAGREVFYSFAPGFAPSGPEGPLVPNAAGFVYGATVGGGQGGYGTVFKLDKNGNENTLHEFDDADGNQPSGGLVQDAVGNLYGTTYLGGPYNAGTVFRMTP
jgi:uncharacterized repeat protein (TIGR03803 family)